MALYRTISMNFWTDSKIIDDFTPEDRYFYLYLFTNPHTNLCGCYEISIRQMVNEVGYSRDSIDNLLKRFQDVHGVIGYSPETKEILIVNWHRYNWTNSSKFRTPLEKEIKKIKDDSFREYLTRVFNGEDVRYPIDTTCIDTTDTVTDTVTVSNTDNNNHNTNDKDKELQAKADDLFETLWSMYPKKRGKGSVTSKQKRRLLEIGFDGMARCIDRYTEEMKGQSEKYIKNGSTFFNSGYVDYLDENYSPMLTKAEKDAQLFRNVAHEYIRDGEMIGL